MLLRIVGNARGWLLGHLPPDGYRMFGAESPPLGATTPFQQDGKVMRTWMPPELHRAGGCLPKPVLSVQAHSMRPTPLAVVLRALPTIIRKSGGKASCRSSPGLMAFM